MSVQGLKKGFILLFLSFAWSIGGGAQTRYAFVDVEYILNHIPDYAKAQEELKVYAQKLQGEVDKLYKEIEEMRSKYTYDKAFQTPAMREKREKEIAEKENKARLLQENYFGPAGELFKKREELIRPIQEEILEVIKDVAKEGNCGAVFDVSTDRSILFYDPKLDKSATVLRKLGFSPGKSETEPS